MFLRTMMVVAAAALLAGCGAAAPGPAPAGAARPFTVALATRSPEVTQNQDAVPDPGGTRVVFTGTGPGGTGIFTVPAAGGATAPLAVGTPFRTPVGIEVSAAGDRVLVADTAADVVFAVPLTGGPAVPVAGTRGLRPRGLAVVADLLYVTGVDPTGRPALMSLPVDGGAATVVATGFVAPDAVTVGPDGTVFVTDRGAGSVLAVRGGTVTPIAEHLRLGDPAGLSLTPNGALLVSSLAPDGTAQVLVLDPATGASQVFDDVIGDNPAAGGLHRAHDADVYAWADRRGGVYVVRPTT